jgi:hypothetical protein
LAEPGSAPRPIRSLAETVAELPMFVDAFRHRIPATEYYLRRDKTDDVYAIVRGTASRGSPLRGTKTEQNLDAVADPVRRGPFTFPALRL